MIKNLFIIDGAAASGKSDLIKFLKEKYHNSTEATFIQKFTTRGRRDEEIDENIELDLIHISESEFEQKVEATDEFLSYEYGNPNRKKKYGFYLSDIQKAFEKHKNVFIIIRNVPTAKELIKELPDIRSILVYVYTDEEKAVNRLKSLGNSSEQIKERLERLAPSWDDFLTFNSSYNEVIINNSSLPDYHKLIVSLIDNYNSSNPDIIEITNEYKYPLLNSLKGHKKKIIKKVESQGFEKMYF